MDYYLGLEMKQMENDIFVSQESYGKVLKKFQKFDYNFLNTPMEGNLILSRLDGGNKEDPNSLKSLAGNLRYLICTRLDIMYVVDVVCRFMESLIPTHMKEENKFFCYLRYT